MSTQAEPKMALTRPIYAGIAPYGQAAELFDGSRSITIPQRELLDLAHRLIAVERDLQVREKAAHRRMIIEDRRMHQEWVERGEGE